MDITSQSTLKSSHHLPILGPILRTARMKKDFPQTPRVNLFKKGDHLGDRSCRCCFSLARSLGKKERKNLGRATSTSLEHKENIT